MRRAKLALQAGILLAFACAMLPAAALAEPACTNSWTGPNEGTWQTAANWSLGKVPSSSDVACLAAGKIVKVTEGSNHAGVVLDKGTLVIDSKASLEVTNATEASSIASLNLRTGTLTGAATVNISSSLVWESNGVMAGSGKTVVQSGASGTMEAGGAEPMTLQERSLVNETTLTFGSGQILMSNGAVLQNKGTFNANSETQGEFESADIEVAAGSTSAPSISNSGTFQKAMFFVGRSTSVAVSINNEGTVRSTAISGSLSFRNGGSSGSSATWAVSEAAHLNFKAGSFSMIGSKWAGPGRFEVIGASLSAENVEGATANIELTSGSLSIAKGSTTVTSLALLHTGTLTGAGTLSISGSLLWEGSGLMSGSGKTILQSGATGKLESGGGEPMTLQERTLVNEGTLAYEWGVFYMSNGAVLQNKATFNANSEIEREGEGFDLAVAPGSTSAPSIVNTGTFQKTKFNPVANRPTTVTVSFGNFGIIRVLEGQLQILNPIVAEPSTQYGGSNPSMLVHPNPHCGKPVSCATGNLYETQSDLSVGGRGVGMDLTRTYNSQAAAAGTKGIFGYGWSSSFSDHLGVEKEAKRALLTQANGSTVAFAESGGSFTAPVGSQDTLSGSAEAGYTLTLANQVKYKFAGTGGQLESITDRNGNATTLAYSKTGLLETVTDPAGRKLSLAYNGEGLVESIKDPVGHTTKYAYEAGSLKSVTKPGELTARWQFAYDASHQLTEMIDGRGGKTLNEYNAKHQVISQKDPLERTLSFEYAGFETKITNQATGAVTDERFTSNDEPFVITRGLGTASATTESFTYNEGGYVTGTTDGNGHTTKYGYDAAGNRTSILDANERETKWTYDATHDVETTTNPKGETTTIKRDVHGNPEVIERPAPGAKTQLTKSKFGAHGETESVTDPLERTWKYEYNAHGDRTSETDPEGDKRTWEYNEDSQEIATVSPRGHVKAGEEAKYTTKTERDEQGRLIKVTDPLAHVTKYEYDKDGNIEVVTDPNLRKTTFSYNADNELIKTKQASGGVIETAYDGAGQVTSQTDANKNVTKYARNAVEEVTEITDPLGRKTTKEYDTAGNLKTVTDAAKRTTTYTFDPGNEVKEISYSDGKTPAVKYEYDADGNRKVMSDGTGKTSYSYDQLDRLTEVQNGHKETVKYEYDIANEQTKLTYPNGKAVTKGYDKAGRLEKITDWLEHIIKFSYSADSVLASTTFPTATSNVDKYAYNEADQMKEVSMTKGAEVLASLVYTRDSNGQVKKTTAKGLPGTEITENTYDTNNRLTKTGTAAYEYDAANNPTKQPAGTYAYNKASQLETGPSLKYAYDEVGERIKTTPSSGPATTYGYDQAGNLTTVTRPKEGEVPAIEDSYSYDGDGVRASQTIAGTTTNLAWDSFSSLPAVVSDGSFSYLYGPSGLPVEQINSEGKSLYLHSDQQGSTRMLTGATGLKEASFTYEAYGSTSGSTGTATSPLGYDGQYTSSDTGLIYLRARSYDPKTAQFMSLDPLNAITGEPYAYAEDNPLNRLDPSGQSVCLFGYCLGWHPVNPLKAVANFGAGLANAAVSTLTMGHVTIAAPFCDPGLNLSYGVGEVTAGAEIAAVGGTAFEAGLTQAGAGPLWSPILAGMGSGGIGTYFANGGHVSAAQEAAGIFSGGVGGIVGNVTGSLVYTPSRAAASGTGGLVGSWLVETQLP